MEMNSKKRIEAIPEKVWKALNDTEVLKASMPGCESCLLYTSPSPRD